MNRWLAVGILGLLSPGVILAHGNTFSEFAPDYYASEGMSVANSGTLEEIFVPQNDFLGGIDLWFDNAGSAGAATMELRDEQGNLLISKGITIPHINPTSGGQRLHIDFPQISVNSSKKYYLKLSSALPELQIYYADRIKYLIHNASYISEYINGVARIDGQEKDFSFKFALAEGAETVPPVVTNLSVTAMGNGQMRFQFNANESVDFVIYWGIMGQGYTNTYPFSGNYQFCGQGVAMCAATITGTLGQTHIYLLTVRDSWGNDRNLPSTFIVPANPTPTPTPTASITPSASVTPPSGDTTPPIISNLRVSDLGNNRVEVAWQTNEAADSHLLISFTTQSLTIAAAADSTMELEHVLDSGIFLSSSTLYRATVTSRDSSDNQASASIAFTTLGATPTPTPAPSTSPAASPSVTPMFSATPTTPFYPAPSVSSSPEVSVSPASQEKGTVTISWPPPSKGNPSGGYRIDIFDKENKLEKTLTVSGDTQQAIVKSLFPGEHRVIVYENKDGVLKKTAPASTFTVGEGGLFGKIPPWVVYSAAPLLIIILLVVLRIVRKKQTVGGATS
ncbi:MAG: hypothetical protein Q7S32_03925 [bacterium]|nr:hypothetical protein [bacterium]